MGLLRTSLKAISRPKLAARELNIRYYWLQESLLGPENEGSIFDHDWDNLVLLDACRYDMFERISELDGNLSAVNSGASCTLEFLERNISGRELHDVVYVTANPVCYRNEDDIRPNFHATIEVWNDGGWDETRRTVPPATMHEFAKRAQEQFPHKRLLLHYLQPHYPFVTSETKYDKHHINIDPQQRDDDDVRFWFKIFDGDLNIKKESIREGYDDNLRLVLRDINTLLDNLEGKTVITSDHGNMLGERSFPIPIVEWGHPCGVHTPELVTVPWLELPYSSRKQTHAEPPSLEAGQDIGSEVVSQRLNDLGYL